MGRLRWVVAVVAVLVLAEGAARVLDGHIAEVDERGHPELEHKWDQAQALAAGPDAPQVVAFGNSMMDGAFVPDVFAATPGGARAYNAAFLNAPLASIDDWADRVIDAVAPTTAIVMVHPLDTVEGDVSFGQDGGTLASSFEDALARLDPGPLDRINDRVESMSALVRHRSTLRQPGRLWDAVTATVAGDPPPAPQRIDEAAPLHEIDWSAALDARGWNSRFRDGALPPDAEFPLTWVGALADDDFDTEPLRDVFASLQQAGRAVVVIPPVATEVLDRSGIPASFIAARAAQLRNLADDAGVDVVDLSDAGYPTTLFHDPVHLNRAGAERFSRDLATALQQ